MSQPAPRVAEAAKKTVNLHVRVTRLEAQAIERKAEAHDPPTVAAWIRDLITAEIRRSAPPRK